MRITTRAALTLAAAASFVVPTGAQSHAGSTQENAFDDEAPWDGFAALDYPNDSLLAVRFTTLGGADGYLVTAGNDWPAVAVRRLNGGHTWTLDPPIVLPLDQTEGAYDLELADFNGDGNDDLAIGRQLNKDDFDPTWTDHVILAGPSFPYYDAQLSINTVIELRPDVIEEVELLSEGASLPPADETDYFINHRATFGLDVGDLNGDGVLDIVAVGSNYGIRYFEGAEDNGTWSVEHLTTYVGPDFQYEGTPGEYTGFSAFRSVELEDIDGDGDLDMFVSRQKEFLDPTSGATVKGSSDLVFYNLTSSSGHEPAPGSHPLSDLAVAAGGPFYLSSQYLTRPTPPALRWRLIDSATGAPLGPEGQVQPGNSTFEARLADLDDDGDPDVVCASSSGLNAAWLNNGNGEFGSLNDPSAPNDGLPAYTFPAITKSWRGVSCCVLELADDILRSSGQPQLPAPGPGQAYSFVVPGSFLNRCTGVAIAKIDDDDRYDIAFSNRNDYQELCIGKVSPAPSSAEYYLNSTKPVPPVYDLVFYGSPGPAGTLAFETCVELLLDANDGTGYGELVDIDGDGVVDWLDANFSNALEGGSNRLLWGKAANPFFGCAVTGTGGPAPLLAGDSTLKIDFDSAVGGVEFRVLLSSSPVTPAVGLARGQRLRLLDLASVFDAPVPHDAGGRGWLDESGRAEVSLDSSWLRQWFGRSWMTVVAVEGGEVLRISDALRLEDPSAP